MKRALNRALKRALNRALKRALTRALKRALNGACCLPDIGRIGVLKSDKNTSFGASIFKIRATQWSGGLFKNSGDVKEYSMFARAYIEESPGALVKTRRGTQWYPLTVLRRALEVE